MSKIKFALLSMLESLTKIETYSKDFANADEIWDIIQTKLIPLKRGY